MLYWVLQWSDLNLKQISKGKEATDMEKPAWLITVLLQPLIEWNVSAGKSSSQSVKTHPGANDDGTHTHDTSA